MWKWANLFAKLVPFAIQIVKLWRRKGGGIPNVATDLTVIIDGLDGTIEWNANFMPTSWQTQIASDEAFTVNVLNETGLIPTVRAGLFSWSHGDPAWGRVRPFYGTTPGDWTTAEASFI
jgi:hypothetical protein